MKRAIWAAISFVGTILGWIVWVGAIALVLLAEQLVRAWQRAARDDNFIIAGAQDGTEEGRRRSWPPSESADARPDVATAAEQRA